MSKPFVHTNKTNIKLRSITIDFCSIWHIKNINRTYKWNKRYEYNKPIPKKCLYFFCLLVCLSQPLDPLKAIIILQELLSNKNVWRYKQEICIGIHFRMYYKSTHMPISFILKVMGPRQFKLFLCKKFRYVAKINWRYVLQNENIDYWWNSGSRILCTRYKLE